MSDRDLLLAVSETVDKIREDVTYVRGEQIRNEEWHKSLDKNVMDIHDAVHGNGQPGLTKEIQCIDNAVVGLDKRLETIETERRSRDTLKTTSKLEWLRGWRAVFFTGLTVLISTAITLGLSGFFSP